jgi:hypothetical protein
MEIKRPLFALDNLNIVKQRAYDILIWLLILISGYNKISLLLINRNLFIDEANVARNIFERSYYELLFPLDYEQYATPIYLWIVKTCSLIFGMGEYSLRLPSLFAGICLPIVFVGVFKKLGAYRSVWFPLLFICFAAINHKYSTELKQYMLDALVCMSLVYFALKFDIFKKSRKEFIIKWSLIGTICIWTSMPSVFVLASVMLYYFIQLINEKKLNYYFRSILFVSIIWLLQFALYYYFILMPQANSVYLQNFHKEYFLVADWEHMEANLFKIKNLINEATGFTKQAFITTLVFIAVFVFQYLRNNLAKGGLLVMPILLMIIAAFLKQYSLIPRVVIFSFPFFIAMMGIGFYELYKIKFLRIILIIWCIYIGRMHYFNQPIWAEEITDEFQIVRKNGVTGNNIYIYQGLKPAYIYYTEMHPKHQSWNDMKNATILDWQNDYEQLAQNLRDKSAFLFTSISEEEIDRIFKLFATYNTVLSETKIPEKRVYVIVASPKQDQ